MKARIYTITLLLTFGFINLLAQKGVSYSKGFLVDLKGDTIFGEIKLNSRKPLELQEKVYVKKSETEKKFFRPNKAKTFTVEEVTYVSKKLGSDEHFFLRRLCDGHLKLYDYRFYWEKAENDDKTKAEYYVQKADDEKVTKLKQKGNYVKILEGFMDDRQDLLLDFGDAPFDIEKITELFEEYNSEEE